MKYQAQLSNLPADLQTLISSLPDKLMHIKRLSPLGVDTSQRGSYQIRMRGGRLLKGRSLESCSAASRYVELMKHVGASHFPGILKYEGQATLEEWVPTPEPVSTVWSDTQTQAAGALLGTLHCTELPIDRFHKNNQFITYQLSRLHELLNRCSSMKVFSASQCDRLASLALEHAPKSTQAGLIHLDFCAENMVFANDKLYCIDNESIDTGPFDADLARTLFRWPELNVEAFRIGYSPYRSFDSYDQHALFWLIYTALNSLHYRLQCGHPTSRELNYLDGL